MIEHIVALDVVIGHPGEIDHVLAIAAAGYADVGLARFARAIDHAAEHRKAHRRLDVLEPLLERLNRANHVEALPRAARARHHPHAAGAQAQRLEHFVADLHFLFGFGRKRHADRVADPCPQQAAHADRTLHRAADETPGFGNAQMKRAIHRLGKSVIGGHRKKHVACLHSHLEFVEIVVLQQLDVIERAFDQRLGAGLAVFLEQVLLEAACVDPDADGAAIGLGRAHHFGNPLAAADIARIDAQAGGALVGRF